MKKINNLFVLILVFAGIVALNSCEEELILEKSVDITEDLFLKKITVGDIEAFINPICYDMHLEVEEDDDLKISKGLLELGLATRDIFKDSSNNKILKEKALLNISTTFNMNEIDLLLKSSNRDMDNIKTILNNIDLTRDVISRNMSVKTETERYIPAIFIPNLNTADFSLKPIISPGIGVNCDIKGLEDFEDYIIAWYYDDENNLNEFFLSEEMSMKTKHPIFIFDNADAKLMSISPKDSMLTDVPISKSMNNNTKLRSGHKDFYSNEYKLEYRFETCGKSEFWIVGLWVVPDFSRYEYLRYGDSNHEIKQVDKDDIGKQLSGWRLFNDWDLEPFDETHVFFNTYERDWSRSVKNFGVAHASCQYTNNSMTLYLSGRARYRSDWYTFDPNLPLPRIDMAGIYSNWAEWFESDHGNFRIWRCD